MTWKGRRNFSGGSHKKGSEQNQKIYGGRSDVVVDIKSRARRTVKPTIS